MNVKTAVVARIKQLCKERNMALNALANSAGITPSTLYSLLEIKRKDIGIVTLKRLYDGFDISLVEFFDADVFEKLEQEMR